MIRTTGRLRPTRLLAAALLLLAPAAMLRPLAAAPVDATPVAATADDDAAENTAEHDDGEDKYDLSHANGLPSQDKADEWKYDLAIYTFIVFLLLMAILVKFAWGPIAAALDRREGRIAALIDEAEQSSQRAQQQLAAYEEKLSEAHKEADAIVGRAKQAAQEQADEIVAAAKAASQREKDEAVAEILQAKNAALGEITQKSVDLAVGLAKGILGRELKPSDHDDLIKATIDRFPS